jgi:hypothetical protein
VTEFTASRAAMTFDSDEGCMAGAVLLVLLALSCSHCNGS